MSELDHDALLQPISDDQPCGEDMQFSAEFDSIRDMRRADDPTLDQGVWVRDLKVADFVGVRALSLRLLRERSKDLRLCGWLTEACSRIDGFAGMAQALGLTTALCDAYWDSVYPLPDGDDQDERIGNLNWLLKQVEDLAATLPLITHGALQPGRRTIESTRATTPGEDDSELRRQSEELQTAIQKTPGPRILAHMQSVQAALDQLVALQQVIDTKLPDDGPSFSSARQSLGDTLHLLKRIAKEKGLVEPSTVVGDVSPTEPEAAAHADTSPRQIVQGPLQSRAQALQQLRQVAAYFRQTEPHSPVAYLAEKAARWGEVPLHDWLRTVVKDPAVLNNLQELLGVEPPGQSDSESY
jgi:type VI secretion system protein ImpA